jgi:hypothetical protein
MFFSIYTAHWVDLLFGTCASPDGNVIFLYRDQIMSHKEALKIQAFHPSMLTDQLSLA